MRPNVDPPSAVHSPDPQARHQRLFFSHSLTLSQRLFLCMHPFSLPVKVLTIIARIRSRHSLLCGFVALPCDASAAQPGQPPV